MPYQYDKLRGRIIEKYGTQGNFAKALGLSSNSVSKKLNCRTGFTQEEMNKWAELLDITSCLRTKFTEFVIEQKSTAIELIERYIEVIKLFSANLILLCK